MTAQTLDPSMAAPPIAPPITAPIVPANAHASPRALARATLGAAGAAAVILVAFVLPAEAGIDPTGIGKTLGIAGMAAGEQADNEIGAADRAADKAAARLASLATPSRATIERTAGWRSDEKTIELPPHSGQEIKAHMNAGDSFVFEWHSTGGAVKVDMHGERPNAPDGEFTSYWKDGELDGARGDFTAPFAGTHGWYWRNKGDTPVTITVRTTGFYKDLFVPDHE